MGVLDFLKRAVGVGVKAAKTATNPVGSIAAVLDKYVETPEERATADRIKIKMLQAPYMAQAEINRVEAGHRSRFVAGWRPAVGWVCAAALAWQYLVHPLLTWATATWWPHVDPPPVVDDGTMMTVLMAMLGIGGMRTLEKTKGVSR